MSSSTGQPRNRRCIRVSQQRMTKLRLPENCIEHQNVRRRRSSGSSASIYIRVYTSEADFHKPEIYGERVRVWATELDVFHYTPSRGGRGCRAAVGIFRGVLFWCLVGFLFRFLYFERTRPTTSTRQPCLMYLPTSTDCESCARPILTNPGSMEAGECGLTRGTCFAARRLELIAVAGRLCLSLIHI